MHAEGTRQTKRVRSNSILELIGKSYDTMILIRVHQSSDVSHLPILILPYLFFFVH